jgi:hypothetical protein
MNFAERIKHARRAGVPILAVNTPDPRSTMESLSSAVNGSTPVVCWDVMAGLRPVNEAGKGALEKVDVEAADGNPVAFLEAASELPEGTVVCFLQADAWIEEPPVLQGVWNLRDQFKTTSRTLVLVARQIQLPLALQGDVVVLDEEPPTAEELGQIAVEMDDAARDANPDRKPIEGPEIKRVIESTTGCVSSFQAEQIVSMALRKDGFDFDHLWESRISAIEQTKGLSVDREKVTFDDIGGLEQIKLFGRELFEGPHPYSVVVRIEEIEKAMGGASSDSSGTSQDALQVMLTCMEDYGWTGILAFGCPGGGKSLYSKALANTFGKMPICFDINGCKDSLVGNSEKNIREAMRVIRAIGGDRVFCVATANRLNTIPGELKRRFSYGAWMFDFPTQEERSKIWPIHRAKYGIDENDEQPNDEAFAGSDIRNCCKLAWEMGKPLTYAAQFLGPVGKVASDVIRDARKLADGRFLSVTQPGLFEIEDASSSKRKVEI